MCGIAGIVRPHGGQPVAEAALLRMAAAIRHRGPDGYGLALDPGAGLVSTRLAIVDLPCGWQPLEAADDGDLLVYNGEVYNHLELRDELWEHGETFETSSDTEVVLRLLERDHQEDVQAAAEWGNKALAASRKADELRGQGNTADADKFDNLAKIALQRQISEENQASAVEPTIAAQTEVVEKLKDGLNGMKQKLEQLKSKRSEMLARQKTAEAQIKVHDAVKSIDGFNRVLELSPNDVPTMIWLGRAYLDTGQPEKAEPVFERARQLAPLVPSVLVGLGQAALARRDFARAASTLEEALTIDSGLQSVHSPLAMAYRGLGDTAKAEAHLKLWKNTEVLVPDPFRRELDLVLDMALADAARSDKLADTVGYDQVVAVTSDSFCARRYRLVEAAAGAVANAILARFPQVTSVRVTVHKPHAPIAATFDDVGVSILRTRHG